MIKNLYCSFCSKNKNEVNRLIVSNDAYICDNCIENCYKIIKKQKASEQSKKIEKWNYTPKQLFKFLNDYIISQSHAKKVLSVAVYNHYKRLRNGNISDDVELDKSNILLLGPTGSGKTLMARTLARFLDVPFTVADATTLTEAGYVGDDVENVIKNLLEKCDFDPVRAEKGIIFIDEIDKISRRSDSVSITRDVSGEGVQQAMLKLIEGTIASVAPQGGRKHPDQKTINVDTSKILFICGGAFDGLDKIINQRIEKSTKIGFSADIKNKKEARTITTLFKLLEPDDLVKFGLIPELVGRLAIYTSLEELDENNLVEILIKPKNSIIKQFQKLFAIDKINLIFKKNSLLAIARLAIKRKTGARGLRTIIEKLLLDTMYEIPSVKTVKEIIIDKDVVEGNKKPILIHIDANQNLKNSKAS